MTERELYIQSIPVIAEMVMECRKMTSKEYADIKNDILEKASKTARPFMRKIFAVIELQLQEV